VTTSSYQSSWTDNWCNAFCYNELFVQTQFDINYNVDSNHTHQITSIYMRESPSWNNGNQLPIFASDHMQTKITDPNGSSPWYSKQANVSGGYSNGSPAYPGIAVFSSSSRTYWPSGNQNVYFEHDYSVGVSYQSPCYPGYGNACPGSAITI